MTPPGLSLSTVSAPAWERASRSTTPRYYFDWERTRKALASGSTPFTPAVTVVASLDAALGLLLEEGLDAAFARHAALGRACREGAKAMGLELCSPDEERSAVVTAILTPDGVDAKELVLELATASASRSRARTASSARACSASATSATTTCSTSRLRSPRSSCFWSSEAHRSSPASPRRARSRRTTTPHVSEARQRVLVRERIADSGLEAWGRFEVVEDSEIRSRRSSATSTRSSCALRRRSTLRSSSAPGASRSSGAPAWGWTTSTSTRRPDAGSWSRMQPSRQSTPPPSTQSRSCSRWHETCRRRTPRSRQGGLGPGSASPGIELGGEDAGRARPGTNRAPGRAPRARLGMRVVAYDPFVSSDRFREPGVARLSSLEEVYAEWATFVTLHLPLYRRDAGPPDAAAFEADEGTAFGIVNAARGDPGSTRRPWSRPFGPARWPVPHSTCSRTEPYSGPLLELSPVSSSRPTSPVSTARGPGPGGRSLDRGAGRGGAGRTGLVRDRREHPRRRLRGTSSSSGRSFRSLPSSAASRWTLAGRGPPHLTLAAHVSLAELRHPPADRGGVNGAFQGRVDEVRERRQRTADRGSSAGSACLEQRVASGAATTRTSPHSVAYDGECSSRSPGHGRPRSTGCPRRARSASRSTSSSHRTWPFLSLRRRPGCHRQASGRCSGRRASTSRTWRSRAPPKGGTALMVFSIDSPAPAVSPSVSGASGFADVRFISLG